MFTDPRDGKVYKTVKIGEQIWLAQNLNYEAEGSLCYDNDPANAEKYGRLYDFETAKKACPPGWHLPSKEEWQTLVDFVGGWEIAGKKLKAVDFNGTDEFSFTAILGGFGDSDGRFGSLGVDGHYGYWWSATENGIFDAYRQNMRSNHERIHCNYTDKSYLFSIRCIKD